MSTPSIQPQGSDLMYQAPPAPYAPAGPSGWRLLAWAVVLYVAQLMGAELGLALTAPGSVVSLAWLPAGIAVAGWMRLGWVAMPVIWLAAYTIELRLGLSPLLATVFALGATLGPWLTVTLLKLARLRAVMDSQREVYGFMLAAGAGAALAAGIGTATLHATGRLPAQGPWMAMLWWWMGDWVGCVVAGPLLVMLTRRTVSWWRAQGLRISLLVGLVTLASLLAFSAWSIGPPGLLLLAYLPLPFVMLTAIRGGPLGTALAATVLSVSATWGAVAGHGPFASEAGGIGMQSALSLWAYILLISLASMVICALQVQRQRAEHELLGSRDQLDAIRQAQTAFISGQDARSVFEGLLHALLRLTDSEIGFIGEVRRDAQGEPYVKVYARSGTGWAATAPADDEDEDASPGAEFHDLDTLVGAVITGEAPVIANDADADPRSGGLPDDQPPLDTFMGLPYFADGELLGMLCVANRPQGYDVALCDRLAPILETCATLTAALQARTARIDADEQLRDSEARYRHMFERNPNMMCVYDRETLGILDANEAMAAHYGYERDELLGMTMCDIRPTEAVAEFLAKNAQMRGEASVTDSARHLRRDGSVIEVEGEAHNITHAGRPARLIVLRDVTRQRQAERDLVASEASHRQMFLKHPHPMWVFDLQTLRFLDVNEAAVAQYGYSRDEFLSMSIEQIRPPQDVALLHAKLSEGVRDLRRHDRARHVKRDGSVIEVEGSVHSIVYQGRPARLALAIDITDRVASEATRQALLDQLSEVANHVPGAIYEFRQDPQGRMRFSYISDRVTDLLGVSPRVVLNDLNAGLERVFPEDRGPLMASIRASAAGLALWRAEFRVRRADGQVRYVRGSSTPQRQPDGSIIWHGYLQDITDLHALEEALRERSAADSANRAKTAFLSRMSHELRTPLNAVLGFAQLLDLDRAEPLTPEQRRRVGHIRDAGQHLLDMIVELLDLTRIESGQLQFRIDAVPLQPLFEEVVALFEPDAARMGVSIRLEIHPSAPACLGTDPTRLRQVLANLVGNAVKYNRANGWVKVEVVPQAGDDGQPGVRIDVADGGIGMNAEQSARLFEPFNRLGRERSEVSGSGIGLALSKALVELLGGHIRARSEADMGSTFTVWLPELWPDTSPGEVDDGGEG